MKDKKKIVLEWTEIDGKKIPKKVIYIVSNNKLPKINKKDKELIQSIFDYGNL